MSGYSWRRGWRKYLKVFSLGWQEQMEYRANHLFETLLGLISFLVLFFLWRAIYAANHGVAIAGLSFQEMFTYILLAKFWDWVIDPTTEIDNPLPEDIRHGGLNRFLIRPINDRLYRFSRFCAHKALSVLMRIGPIVLLIFLLPQLFTLHPSPSWWLLPMAGALAMILQFAFSYAVAMVAFWWLEIWGILFLKRMVVAFLAGSWMPLSLFPEKLSAYIMLLPFQYMIFFPVQIALGKLPPAQIQAGIVTQMIWIGIFLIAGRIIWSFGMKRYTAAGI
jgi:ABC-2 type transport system permease protein